MPRYLKCILERSMCHFKIPTPLTVKARTGMSRGRTCGTSGEKQENAGGARNLRRAAAEAQPPGEHKRPRSTYKDCSAQGVPARTAAAHTHIHKHTHTSTHTNTLSHIHTNTHTNTCPDGEGDSLILLSVSLGKGSTRTQTHTHAHAHTHIPYTCIQAR